MTANNQNHFCIISSTIFGDLRGRLEPRAKSVSRGVGPGRGGGVGGISVSRDNNRQLIGLSEKNTVIYIYHITATLPS